MLGNYAPPPPHTHQFFRTEREREMFYLTTHSTHFIYGYMASDIWLRTILIVRKETRCRHIVYCYRLTARVILYAPSHRQDNTYHGLCLCYTSRGALAGTRNSSMGPPHEGSIRRPIAPWANALPLSYVPLPVFQDMQRSWYVFFHQILWNINKRLMNEGFISYSMLAETKPKPRLTNKTLIVVSE